MAILVVWLARSAPVMSPSGGLSSPAVEPARPPVPASAAPAPRLVRDPFRYLEEAPGSNGLGLLRGRILRFPANHSEKVPHMGWSVVEPGVGCYYFAHSYYLPAGAEGVSATVRHGYDVAAIVRRGNLAGTQFHPEKSGPAGLAFLKNWVVSCQQRESSPA